MNRSMQKPLPCEPGMAKVFCMAAGLLVLAQPRAWCQNYDLDGLVRQIALNDALVKSEHLVQNDTVVRYKPDGSTIALPRVVEWTCRDGKFRLSQHFPDVDNFHHDQRVWSSDPRHPPNSIQYFPVTQVWDGQQSTTHVPLFNIAWIEAEPQPWPRGDGNMFAPSSSHRPIEGKTLSELIAEARASPAGKLSAARAELGGNPTWLLEIDRGAGNNVLAYVDESVGFRARCVERYAGDRLWWRVDLDEFEENAHGVWTARQVSTYEANDRGPFRHNTSMVQAWDVNLPLPEEDFKLTLPVGTGVQDKKRRMAYTLKEDTDDLNENVAALLADPLSPAVLDAAKTHAPQPQPVTASRASGGTVHQVLSAGAANPNRAGSRIRRVLLFSLGAGLLLLALTRIRRKGASWP